MSGDKPATGREAIIESGIRADDSPFALRGVGAIACAADDGAFESLFATAGADRDISAPETVSVFVQVARGSWEPVKVHVAAAGVTQISAAEILLNLGDVQAPNSRENLTTRSTGP